MATPAPAPAASRPSGIWPAQLGFLAIYNPSLGHTDETMDEQIVYYASVDCQASASGAVPVLRRRRRQRAATAEANETERPTDGWSQEERNERLRQVGLAQGMVEFGRSFSGGRAVDAVDSEKSRVVLHELEPGWWILASIDLSRTPLARRASSALGLVSEEEEVFEYSSREVKPAALLLQDLLRAHSIFLLHHASSLSALFVRSQRIRFVRLLTRYWDQFLSTWNVMLHGNPARSMFGGINMAACGELGVGVGEEERGSGEREVLEGMVDRIEGLVDLVVGKYGDEHDGRDGQDGLESSEQWLGTGGEVASENGAVFLGTGALSRHSLRDVIYWMEDVYIWGEHAYGVNNSPTATGSRRTRKTRERAPGGSTNATSPISGETSAKSSGPASSEESGTTSGSKAGSKTGSKRCSGERGDATGMDRLLSYLKLGYKKSWAADQDSGSLSKSAESESKPASSPLPSHDAWRVSADGGAAHYLIGLTGEIEEEPEPGTQQGVEGVAVVDKPEPNSRTVLRTLTVELEREGLERRASQVMHDFGSQDTELALGVDNKDAMAAHSAVSAFDSQDRNKSKKLRVVVYVSRPFIFTFLFDLTTECLAWKPFYQSLHHQLVPLHKSLLTSTTYRSGRGRPDAADSVAATSYDLIWDPRELTVHSTIPNIQDPGPIQTSSSSSRPAWTRAEALNTHLYLVQVYTATRADLSENERTSKTPRGWWIVWKRFYERDVTRFPNPSPPGQPFSQCRRAPTVDATSSSKSPYSQSDDASTITPELLRVSKEIFLVCKSGGGHHINPFAVPGGGGLESGGWVDRASRLAHGIGVDTKRYIDGLLHSTS